jgi:hypothetical protein
MAGSNGSSSQRGGQPPQHWPAENDAEARALELERWQREQQLLAQQRGYPPGHHPAPHGQGSYPPQGGYAPPPAYEGGHGDHAPDFSHNPQGYPPPGQQSRAPHHGHAGNAPHFERFNPGPPPQQGETFGQYDAPRPGERYEDPRFAGGRRDHHPDLTAAQFHPDPAGYPGQPGSPMAHDPRFAGERGDVQSWDLSHYQPGQVPQGYGAPPAHPPHYDPGLQQPGWGQQGAGYEPQWVDPNTQPGHQNWQHLDAATPHGHGGYGVPQHGHPESYGHDPRYGQQAHGPEEGYEHENHEPVEPERRGPSTLVIVGALVGAIVLGGGLALAYKQFGGGSKDKAALAEIKRPGTPEKVRPKDPGGKTIDHSDKKFLNRLASGSSENTSQRQSDVEGTTKKVSTIPIVVNRDGSLSPQPAPPPADSGVPGLVLDGFGPPPVPAGSSNPQRTEAEQQAPVSPATRVAPPPPPPLARSIPPPPRVADLPLPRVVNSAPARQQDVTEREAAPAATRRTAAVRDDFVAQRGRTAAIATDAPSGLGSAVSPPARRPVAAKSGGGFVAVLASKKNRQDALNSFADLHSQFPDVLTGFTPDVREANLGERGVWYRLIVGPPGSREAARTLCSKLKQRGMKDCWPVAF